MSARMEIAVLVRRPQIGERPIQNKPFRSSGRLGLMAFGCPDDGAVGSVGVGAPAGLSGVTMAGPTPLMTCTRWGSVPGWNASRLGPTCANTVPDGAVKSIIGMP